MSNLTTASGQSDAGDCSPSSFPWIGNCPICHTAYRTHAPEDTSKPLELKCGRMECVGMVTMTPIGGFPETDDDTEAELAAWELLREARAELETLREAVRNFRDVKGRFHTQLAAERLIALLPENAPFLPPVGAGVSDEGTNEERAKA